MSSPTIEMVASEARRQQYNTPADVVRAVNRVLRWMRSARNKGVRPPGHIAQKMKLMRVK